MLPIVSPSSLGCIFHFSWLFVMILTHWSTSMKYENYIFIQEVITFLHSCCLHFVFFKKKSISSCGGNRFISQHRSIKSTMFNKIYKFCHSQWSIKFLKSPNLHEHIGLTEIKNKPYTARIFFWVIVYLLNRIKLLS